MTDTTDMIEDDDDRTLTMVDEALVAGNIANTNGLLVILAKLVAKGIFDADDLHAFSDSYSKPLDHENMRENELISQMQDQMEATLAQLMHFLADKGADVRIVEPRDGRIHLDDIARGLEKGGVRLVSVFTVSNMTGFCHDLTALTDLAHRHGALVYADVIQLVGSVPFDAVEASVDFLRRQRL